jgi:two-component system, cell cycle sensor histidine kinase and response regulator CckA
MGEDATGEPTAGRTQTLLIVDDEEMLVELLRRMLIRQGYEVIATTNANEALQLYSRNEAGIALVITDLVMPEMDGRRLAEELLRRNPETRILISTGFSAANDITSLLETGVKGIVIKPYQSEQLFEKVREALAA